MDTDCKMITKTADVVDLFNIFHDGKILVANRVGEDICLTVSIEYLAKRIHSNFKSFQILLQKVEELTFHTWPHKKDDEPSILNSLVEIFKPPLDILDANIIENQGIEVICNQADIASEFCGGNLYFRTTGAIVTDESGKQYSIEELGRLCEEYWDEWQQNGRTSGP